MKRSYLSLTFLLKGFCASAIAVLVIQTEALATNSFQQALQLANSLKGKSQEAVTKFNPQEAFKNQKGGYTEEPAQMGYYKDVTQPNAFDLEKAAHQEILQDESVTDKDGKPIPTPGKAVAEGFQKREVYKINREAEFMQKGKLITGNAQNIVMGESNKNIDCETQKLAACKTVQVKESCNEEVRSVQRVCEKAPSIKIIIQPYQETQQYSGEIPAKDAHNGTFSLPISGTITSFWAHFTSNHIRFGVWECSNYGGQGDGYLENIHLSRSSGGPCGRWISDMEYSNDSLRIPVVAGNPIKFRFDGRARRMGFAGPEGSWTGSQYRASVIVNLEKKVPEVSWSESCHDI